MIVVDASALLEMLLATASGSLVSERIRVSESINAPQLLIVECLQVLRRSERRGDIDTDLATALVQDLLALDIELYDHVLLADRIWELRNNLTAYDAAYVALSELLEATLITTDAKLASAPGNHANVELINA